MLPPDDPRHGVNGYSNLGCRCGICRQAATTKMREYNHRTARHIPREHYLAIQRLNLVHGTEAGYKRGCRCGACRNASRVARWERRQVGDVLTHNASGYKNGCRCDTCRQAHREWMRVRRAARA